MECSVARKLFFRKIDNELSPLESREVDLHLGQCDSCAREHNLIMLPGRIAQAIPVFKPSPYFYQTLRSRIESEVQSITIWQLTLSLSRQLVPALAAITLAILSVFAYLQLYGPQTDLRQAYDKIFSYEDQAHLAVIVNQGEITDEIVLRAIADQEPNYRQNLGP